VEQPLELQGDENLVLDDQRMTAHGLTSLQEMQNAPGRLNSELTTGAGALFANVRPHLCK
jgi:hypothetical protein